ncbi:MAG: polysaccharide biosynthesis/export family protein [Alkalinema sp. CAN_BIN05]|nr:polysaccharide biosynthesis/export family protein [Alkalinema sp. CAN_BIN05]
MVANSYRFCPSSKNGDRTNRRLMKFRSIALILGLSGGWMMLTIDEIPTSFLPSTRFDSSTITAIQEEDDTLGPGDRINVDVLKAPQYNTLDTQVLVDGTLSFVQVGRLSVQGMTIAEAAVSSDRIRVNVIGEIEKPGLLELPPEVPLTRAIVPAAGFNRRADRKTVELIRLNPDGSVLKRDILGNFAYQGRNLQFGLADSRECTGDYQKRKCLH